MLVSELEKNPEIRMSSASAAKSSPSGASFKGLVNRLWPNTDGGEKLGPIQATKPRLLATLDDEFQH